MRPSKPTKEMEDAELERLKHPEARETTAYDPTELAALVVQTTDDDLAIPVEAAPPKMEVIPVRAPVGMRPLTKPQHPMYPEKRRWLVLLVPVAAIGAVGAYLLLLR